MGHVPFMKSRVPPFAFNVYISWRFIHGSGYHNGTESPSAKEASRGPSKPLTPQGAPVHDHRRSPLVRSPREPAAMMGLVTAGAPPALLARLSSELESMESNRVATSIVAPHEAAQRTISPQKNSTTKAAAAVPSPAADSSARDAEAAAAASAERLARRREAQRQAATLPRPVPNVASSGSQQTTLLRPQGTLAPLRSHASQLDVPRPSSLRLSPLRSSQPAVPKLALHAGAASRRNSPDSDGSDDDSGSEESLGSSRSIGSSASTLSARSRLTHARIFACGVEEAAARGSSSGGGDYRFTGFGGSSQTTQQPSASGSRRTDRRSTQVCVGWKPLSPRICTSFFHVDQEHASLLFLGTVD